MSEKKLTIEEMEEILAQEEECEEGCTCSDNASSEPIEKIMLNFINVINTESIREVSFDKTEFSRGIKEASFFAGQITALVNCGLSPEMAMSYFLNKESVVLQKEMNIEMAKHSAFNKEKNEL